MTTKFNDQIETIRADMGIDFEIRTVIADHANNEHARTINGLMVSIDKHMRGCLIDSLNRELETEYRLYWIEYWSRRIANHAAAYSYLEYGFYGISQSADNPEKESKK